MRSKSKELQPDYNAMRDSWKIRERIETMMEDTNNGKGKTVKFNIEISEELATFAAWLAIRGNLYNKGLTAKVDVSDILETPLSKQGMKEAGGLICDLIFKNIMEEEYEALCQNAHPYLYKNPNFNKIEQDTIEPF